MGRGERYEASKCVCARGVCLRTRLIVYEYAVLDIVRGQRWGGVGRRENNWVSGDKRSERGRG